MNHPRRSIIIFPSRHHLATVIELSALEWSGNLCPARNYIRIISIIVAHPDKYEHKMLPYQHINVWRLLIRIRRRIFFYDSSLFLILPTYFLPVKLEHDMNDRSTEAQNHAPTLSTWLQFQNCALINQFAFFNLLWERATKQGWGRASRERKKSTTKKTQEKLLHSFFLFQNFLFFSPTKDLGRMWTQRRIKRNCAKTSSFEAFFHAECKKGFDFGLHSWLMRSGNISFFSLSYDSQVWRFLFFVIERIINS